MAGSLKVDITELSTLAGLLNRTSDALQRGDSPRVDSVAQVGDKQVASAMHDFYANWDYARKGLAEKLSSLGKMVALAASEYAEKERNIVDACTVNSSDPAVAQPVSSAASDAAAAATAAASAISTIAQLRLDVGASGSMSTFAAGNAAWQAMTVDQRLQLLTVDNARQVGNDASMPPDVRYAANRYLVAEEKYRLQQKTLLTPSEASRLSLYNTILDGHKNVLFFDPANDGRIAVVDGDLGTAKHISVDVPGISNTLDNFSGVMSEGSSLYAQTGGKNGNTAVISWLGYDTPTNVNINVVNDYSQILNDRMAQVGAISLTAFVNGVASGNPGASMTVIGHSYGSLVTGIAASTGHLNADNLVFIGSPGVGVKNVEALLPHLKPHAEVFAMSKSEDPVTDGAAAFRPFGPVPTDPSFNARVITLPTEIATQVGEVAMGPVTLGLLDGAHSSYYQHGSASLQYLGQIVNRDARIYAGPDGIGESCVA